MQPPVERDSTRPAEPQGRIEIILSPSETLYASSIRQAIERLQEHYPEFADRPLNDLLDPFFDDIDSKEETENGCRSLSEKWFNLHPESTNAQDVKAKNLAAPLATHLAFLFEVFPSAESPT